MRFAIIVVLACAGVVRADGYALRPVQAPYQKPYAAAPAAANQTINIIYPAPLYQPGSSVFSGYSVGAFNALDPNIVLQHYSRTALQAMTGMDSAVREGMAYSQTLAQSFGQVATVQAASEHLRVAQGIAQQTPQSITLQTDGKGGWTIKRNSLDEQQPERVQAASGKVIAVCARCHTGATPKGEFLFGPGIEYTLDDMRKALRRVNEDEMPPSDAGGPLTQEQKGKLLEELLYPER